MPLHHITPSCNMYQRRNVSRPACVCVFTQSPETDRRTIGLTSKGIWLKTAFSGAMLALKAIGGTAHEPTGRPTCSHYIMQSASLLHLALEVLQ